MISYYDTSDSYTHNRHSLIGAFGKQISSKRRSSFKSLFAFLTPARYFFLNTWVGSSCSVYSPIVGGMSGFFHPQISASNSLRFLSDENIFTPSLYFADLK